MLIGRAADRGAFKGAALIGAFLIIIAAWWWDAALTAKDAKSRSDLRQYSPITVIVAAHPL
jgi:hypothetical protein